MLLQREHEGDLRGDVGVEALAQQIGVDVGSTDDVLRLAVDFFAGERVDDSGMARNVGLDEEIIVADVELVEQTDASHQTHVELAGAMDIELNGVDAASRFADLLLRRAVVEDLLFRPHGGAVERYADARSNK